MYLSKNHLLAQAQLLSLVLVTPAMDGLLLLLLLSASAVPSSAADDSGLLPLLLLLLPLLLAAMLPLLLLAFCARATAAKAALISSEDEVTVTLGSCGSLGSLLLGLGSSSGKESGKNSSWKPKPAGRQTDTPASLTTQTTTTILSGTKHFSSSSLVYTLTVVSGSPPQRQPQGAT